MLLNLIDNAVKYSPHGGAITVSADRLATGVRVEVEDEGIGIAQSDQEAVFEKFYRADPHQRQVPSGTGLGLYISRELVRRMGGKHRRQVPARAGLDVLLRAPERLIRSVRCLVEYH